MRSTKASSRWAVCRPAGGILLATLTGAAAWGDPIIPGKSPIRAVDIAPVADAAAAPAAQPPNPAGRVSVLVHLAPGADRGRVRGFAAAQGGNVKYEYTILPNVINLRGIPQSALNALAATPGVVRIEQDGAVQAHMNDSTPLIRALQSQINGAGLSANGSGVRVCIIDTGIDSDSAMYADRIDFAAGRDFVNDDNNPEDDGGHGSHVAGTAVGGDNLSVDFGCVGSEPFHGVAPEATLIGIKVLSSSGGGSFSDVIAGIDYGADQTAGGGRCDVINMSLGGGQFSGNCDGDSAAAAANAAVDAGVVVVASSGNNAYTNAMGTPACGSKVISVGATYDDNYPNCEFPSQTTFEFCTCVNIFCCGSCIDNSPDVDQITCMSNRSSALDVTAPGCVTFSADSENSPNGIVGFCGTSMASPHVAGLAALLISADPSLTPAQVRQHIRDGAIDLGASGFDNIYGYGRIDAINSLSLLEPGCTTNGDCNDGNACTTDVCNAGSCSNTPIDCDDGNACTTDSCSGGVCSNDPIDCNDGNACTADSCSGGTCVNDPIDCDDGDACTSDSCSGGVCSNNPISCDDGDPCTVDSCNPGSGCQNVGPGCVNGDGCCPAGCTNANDNDCPTFVCGNGTCEDGEDCDTCPADCFTGSGAVCGNDVCEAGNGEDCVSCPGDCNGVQGGKPQNRYCCGDGDGQNPIGCGDSRCTTGGNTCSNTPATPSCCGDFTCEGTEDSFNCAVDCGDPPFCGDASCDAGEDQCNCPADCGAPPATETNCTDGIDNDCNNGADCADPDCAGDPACSSSCGNGVCESGENCNNCSGDCPGVSNGPPSGRYCCGNGVLEGPESDGRCDGNP